MDENEIRHLAREQSQPAANYEFSFCGNTTWLLQIVF